MYCKILIAYSQGHRNRGARPLAPPPPPVAIISGGKFLDALFYSKSAPQSLATPQLLEASYTPAYSISFKKRYSLFCSCGYLLRNKLREMCAQFMVLELKECKPARLLKVYNL
jgi:hypothetical protein